MRRILFTLLLVLAFVQNAFGQVAVLNGSSDLVQATLSGAITTTNPTYVVRWEGNGGPAEAIGSTTGVTAKTMLAGEASAPPRVVKSVSVYNNDTVAATVSITKTTGGTSYTLSKVTLQSNDTLTWDGTGIHLIDSSGNARVTTAQVVRTGQSFTVGTRAKVGTTAGWTVAAGNNLGTIATVAASQTACTLVVPIDGLHVGDTITAFKVTSSINSAGNTVTLDANLRSLTVAAGATATDASIASITQVSVTAATASAASKTGLTTVVTSGVTYYLLLTCTTGASTTLELDSIEFTVTTS